MWVVAEVEHGTSWELEKVRGNGVMAMLTLAIISVAAALQVFGKDRLIFWRESESGESCCSYLPALALGTSARICRLLPPACSSAVPHMKPCRRWPVSRLRLSGTLHMQWSCAATDFILHLVSLIRDVSSCAACPRQKQLNMYTCASTNASFIGFHLQACTLRRSSLGSHAHD